MTVSSSTRKAGPLSCNGSVTSFPFTFKCFTTADVRVILTNSSAVETDLVLDSTFTVSLNADQNASPGGTVDTVATYASGYTITILSDLDMLQETDIQNQGGFYPEVIENALDKVTMMVQQVKEEVDRAVKVDASSSTLPEDYITLTSTYADNAAASASAAASSASSASTSANTATSSAATIAGFEWKGSWLTSTIYAKNNLVYESGNSYIALSEHTSGTFSTDYSNGKWEIFSAKGAAGAGTGDLLAANNLSEVTPATARANLSAAKSGANSDILSLSGLTTALSIAQGGTGQITAANAFTALKQAASETATGVVELATSAEHATGIDTTRVLTSAVARANNIVLGTAVASTSGTAIDFTGIPAWAKRITLLFNGVSLNGTSSLLVQLGDAGGFETTGYVATTLGLNNVGGSASISSTSGLPIYLGAAAAILTGTMRIYNFSANSWISDHNGKFSTTESVNGGGGKTLTETLDRIRITTVNGADVFDAGSINIMYE